MISRKIDNYLREYFAASRNALLVTGARQIGKTYSIRQFGKSFESFVEVNFVEQPQAVQAFANASSASDILLRLSALTSQPLVPGKTLVFFDEVQLCPNIVAAIKFLVDEGSYRYILSGSLLGVELQDLRSQPVGYMGIKQMFPLDLEEFVRAVGVSQTVIDTIRLAWEESRPVDELVHNKMMELYRLYLVVGGMPQAVSTYLSTNNLQSVMTVQQDILQLYKRDIAQYDKPNKLYLDEIFSLIPPELNAKNKRFVLKSLHDNSRFSRLENSFLWLVNAGVAIAVYNVEEPKPPLLLSRSRNLFKLFQNDVGLLAAQYANGLQLAIIAGNDAINFGAVWENAVAQELLAHGYTSYYYNNKKMGELDFVVEDQGVVLPIEVKSGKDYDSHRALNNVMSNPNYDLPLGIVLTNRNLQVHNSVVYAPVYMTMFMRPKPGGPLIHKVDLSGMQ